MDLKNKLYNLIENELFDGVPNNINSSFKGDHYKMKCVRLPCIPYLIVLYGLLIIIMIPETIYQRSICKLGWINNV